MAEGAGRKYVIPERARDTTPLTWQLMEPVVLGSSVVGQRDAGLQAETPTSAEVEALLGKMRPCEKVCIVSGQSMWEAGGVPRLGLPPLRVTDGPHGARGPCLSGGEDSILSPCQTALAATFNEAMVEQVGALVGEDCAGKGCTVLLGPCLNLQRYPISGRHFECYSEDPYLASRMGVSWIRGVQRHVSACAKHFVGNDQETDRGTSNSIMDTRTLHEVYLAPFEAAVVEGKVESLMTGYNRLNGTYCSEHEWLLNRLLRGVWGFTGFVMSDWWGTRSMTPSLQAGLNLEMPGVEPRFWGGYLLDAVKRGDVSHDLLDARCRPLLRSILQHQQANPNPQHVPPNPGDEGGADVLNSKRRKVLGMAAAESLVLARNEHGVLPLALKRGQRLAVIGPNAASTVIQGGGSSRVRGPRPASLLDNLRAALAPLGVEVLHEQGCGWEWFSPDVMTMEMEGLMTVGASNPDGTGSRRWSSMSWSTWVNDTALGVAAKVSRLTCFRRCCMPVLRTCGLRLSTPEEAERRRSAAPVGSHGQEPKETHCASPRCVGVLAVLAGAVYVGLAGRAADPQDAQAIRAGALALVLVLVCVVSIWLWRVCAASWRRSAEERALKAAEAAAAQADVCVLALGTHGWWEIEGVDQPHMRLLGRQNELAARVAAAAAGRPVVAVLNVGSPKELPWLEDVPGVIVAYFGGEAAAPAIVDALLGHACPAGRLPTTWPRKLEDVPAVAAAAAAGKPPAAGSDLRYEEALFCGYRGYGEAAPSWGRPHGTSPLFHFGHGLSYTAFEYEALQLHSPAPGPAEGGARVGGGPSASVSVTIRNAGSRPGAEVVQLYVVADGQPRALHGFRRTPELAPGASCSVTFYLGSRALGSRFDAASGMWTLPPEDQQVQVEVGASSADVRKLATLTLRSEP